MGDNWNTDPTPDDTSRGRMIEIIQEDPHLDDDAERALRPIRVTGQKLPPRRK